MQRNIVVVFHRNHEREYHNENRPPKSPGDGHRGSTDSSSTDDGTIPIKLS